MFPISLEQIMIDANTLPSFPDIGNEILSRLEDPLSVPDDFIKIINLDPILVSKILKFANSAFYGYPKTIISIKEAIIILGLDTLKSIVLAISSNKLFKNDISGYGLSKLELYEHSLCCAVTSRLLAKKQKLYNKEKYFTAGLLHDIGKLLLNPYVLEKKKNIENAVEIGNMSLNEVEKNILGFDHAEIGSKLAEFWNLPEILVKAIRYHHEPENSDIEIKQLIDNVYTADKFSNLIKKGSSLIDFSENEIIEEVQLKLKITNNEFNNIIEEIKRTMSDLSQFIY